MTPASAGVTLGVAMFDTEPQTHRLGMRSRKRVEDGDVVHGERDDAEGELCGRCDRLSGPRSERPGARELPEHDVRVEQEPPGSAYVALAEGLHATLLTADGRLARGVNGLVDVFDASQDRH